MKIKTGGDAKANYIDQNLLALQRLRDILTEHGIQITNVLGAQYSLVDSRSGLTGVGTARGVHPKLTVELYVPLVDQEE